MDGEAGHPLADFVGIALLAGIGFTTSLLIGGLAFGEGGDRLKHVEVTVLSGSIIAALLAADVLRPLNRTCRHGRESGSSTAWPPAHALQAKETASWTKTTT